MTLDKLNVIDKTTTLEKLISRYEIVLSNIHSYYKQKGIYRLVYSYKILPNKFVYKKPDAVENSFTTELTDTLYTNLQLPNDNNYLTWGVNNSEKFDPNYYHIVDSLNKRYYNIYIYKETTEVEIIQRTNQNDKPIRYIFNDYIINSTCFKRVFNNQEYLYQDNKLVLKIVDKKVNTLSTLKKDKLLIFKTITLDIETVVMNGNHIPFVISYYDGIQAKSFYLDTYINPSLLTNKEQEYIRASTFMIQDCIKSLLKPKYSGYIIYVHNLSNFDGIFLFKQLSAYKDDDINTKFIPLLKEDKMITLKMNFSHISNKRKLKYNIIFRDSLLMLPNSLDKLAKSFTTHSKMLFPYKFTDFKYNPDFNLNYIGSTPDVLFFNNKESNDRLLTKEYIKYINYHIEQGTVNS